MIRHNSFTASSLVETTCSRRDVLRGLAGGAALGLGALLISNPARALAQGTPTANSVNYPEATITAEKDGDGYKFGFPASFPTGFVRVTLVNKSDADHHAMFMRMNPDVTTDQFIEKVKASANPGEFAPLAVSIGGPGSLGPGEQTTVIMNLDEGPYVLICEVPGADGTPHYKMGMVDMVTAQPEGTPVKTPPVAETTVDLVDFSFDNLPATLTPGQHIWEVTNTGKQLHEMVIERLSPGVTGEAALRMITGEGPAATPSAPVATPAPSGPPFVGVGGCAPMNPGFSVWPVLDLAAGNYISVCFVPDIKTGKPHVMLGMFGEFSVA